VFLLALGCAVEGQMSSSEPCCSLGLQHPFLLQASLVLLREHHSSVLLL